MPNFGINFSDYPSRLNPIRFRPVANEDHRGIVDGVTSFGAPLPPFLDSPASRTQPNAKAYFEIYRAEQIRVSSTIHSGGDWRWRLLLTPGEILASGEGYQTAEQCHFAIERLKYFAPNARISSGSEFA